MPFKLYIGPIAILKVDNRLGDRFKVSNLSIFYFYFYKKLDHNPFDSHCYKNINNTLFVINWFI